MKMVVKIPDSKLSMIERELKNKNSNREVKVQKNNKLSVEDLIAVKLFEKINPEIEELKNELKRQNQMMNQIIELLKPNSTSDLNTKD